MATKGASNRYTRTRGSKDKNKTKKINYDWAKDFHKFNGNHHAKDHAKSMGFDSKESYIQHAINFANLIDNKNCTSFIEKKTGSTYKYNRVTNELVKVSTKGMIITYFKPKNEYKYYLKEKKLKGEKIK